MSTHDWMREDVDGVTEFFDRYYRDEIGRLLQRYPNDQDALYVRYTDLFRHNPDLVDDLRKNPDAVHALLEDGLAAYDVPVDVDLSGASVRIHDVPDHQTLGVGEVWQADAGQFTAVRGQVQKVSKVKHEPTDLVFQCQRCGTHNSIPQPDNGEIQEPGDCQGCDRNGPYRIDESASDTRAHQLARIQQPPEETKGGNATHIDAPLTGSLVGSVDAGDRVTLSGTHRLDLDTQEGLFSSYLQGEAADIEETDFEEVETAPYEDDIEAIADGDDPLATIVDSIAPKVRGHDHIKRAVALQLFGGVEIEYPDGSYDRGDVHQLIIGAPGTAKSTILRFVEEVAPRSVYASGKGASAAGMTAAAVRDDFGASEWALEAGALVLANKGIACVDEIDKVQEDAVSSMHDALESQRVNVNKAGINATLPAKTSLLAAGNPKYGRFDESAAESLSEQIDLGPTLLSRFDLIWTPDDTPDREEDRAIAEHMVESRRLANAYNDPETSVDEEAADRIEPALDADLLRAYVAYAKQTVRPRIESESVASDLVESFTELRVANGEEDDVAVPVTFRKLEGIQRLAEASARVRLSETIEQQDVDVARELVGESMKQVGMNEEGEFDVDIVESGTSKPQKERREILTDAVKEHSGTEAATTDDLLEYASEHGLDSGRAEKELQIMKMKGDIYQPGTDNWRLP